MKRGEQQEFGPRPPEGFDEAILAAARAAGIGIAMSAISDGRIRTLWMNETAMAIFGRSPEELAHSDAFEFVAPEEQERLRAHHLQRQDRGVPSTRHNVLVTVIVTGDGRRIPVSVDTTFLELRGEPVAVSFLRDISERKRASESQRVSEAQFRRLMENAPDGVTISRDGIVLWANEASARLVGAPDVASLVGHSVNEFVDPEVVRGARTIVTRAIAEGRRPPVMEFRARRRDGSWLVTEFTSHAIEYEGAPAMIAYSRDVAERDLLQSQLARTDRLAALGTLAAGVAHEINNPLTYVSLGIDAIELSLRGALPPETHAKVLELLEEVRGGASRVAAIVSELRAFSQFHDEQWSVVDLAKVLASAERLVGHQMRVRSTIAELPHVRGDAGRLEQVIVNLLVNAAQALPEDDPRSLIELAAFTGPDGSAVIEVRDNGPGIPRELLSRVFDPFFTTKAPGVGTGLGLSISHRIVTQLGGTITLDSVVGKGTTARVTLPRASSEESVAPAPQINARLVERKRVLVIDDEAALVHSIRCLLEREHEVIAITDGREAARRLLGDERFDVVLCDLSMPAVDGADLYGEVERSRPELADRFVFMTGGAFTQKLTRFVEQVARPCLQKPFRLSELEEVIADPTRTREPASGSVARFKI